MFKANIKSFVYSFSVSLLTIVSVNRVFWCEDTVVADHLNVKEKSISLFFDGAKAFNSPVKSISLSDFSGFSEGAQTPSSGGFSSEIVVADNFEDVVFPLDFSTFKEEVRDGVLPSNNDAVVSEVVYSPIEVAEELKVGAGLVYNSGGGSELVVNDGVSIPVQVGERVSSRSVKVGASHHLSHVALNSDAVTIQGVADHVANNEEVSKEGKDWLFLKNDPWVVAKGGGAKNRIPVKVYAEKSGEDVSKVMNVLGDKPGIQVATETVKNLIIPIPDGIMKKDDLTPKLAYPEYSEDVSKERDVDAKIKLQTEIKKQGVLSSVEEDVVLDDPDVKDLKKGEAVSRDLKEKRGDSDHNDKKEGILGAINSIFSSTSKKVIDAKDRAIAKAQAKKVRRKSIDRSKPVSIMPTEIRLSFQPNKAEISGQTLRWVQAFAVKAAENHGTGLEIRIDGSGAIELQQRRLNLLYNILTHKGVEYSKINTVFTSRDSNSFILSTVTVGGGAGEVKSKIDSKYQSKHIQW